MVNETFYDKIKSEGKSRMRSNVSTNVMVIGLLYVNISMNI